MHERLSQLFDRYYRKTISSEERTELFVLLADPTLEETVKTLILASYADNEQEEMPAAASEAVLQAILGKTVTMIPKPRRNLLAMRWTIAASLALLLATGAYLLQRPHTAAPLTIHLPPPAATPAGNGILLTLANGTRIPLDSAGNGQIATDGGAAIAFKDGQLSYNPAGGSTDAQAYNTISTPRGKQFHLVLSDGTRVWLNAATTLRYPAIFTGPERKVEIIGEAYFEAAGSATTPLRVIVPTQASIQVLGTRFNVNAYTESNHVTTTLLQGAVRVAAIAAPDAAVVLAPGQQARVLDSRKIAVAKVDTESVMAWRNGNFNFDGVVLKEVMQELARWYDIEVVYEKGIPDIRFFGELGRSLPLADVVKALEDSKVHVKMEGARKLVVLP
ncbi:FecR family protein [Chitinophaga nivalis]|uniref:FecR domain-containing protein n=1 Tax=Chitinophaga nivalis TaxID=2991709 RepID=A0ABT3IJP9_9BACT|nr:FecR family protein [Chitinophaga nivalis]MCW3466136.1 FecR domain-containing protein [Chitinophaga nivalis]MCW3484173.1 FecR domain-containing protein [Chitinophaga nivalis]